MKAKTLSAIGGQAHVTIDFVGAGSTLSVSVGILAKVRIQSAVWGVLC